MKNKRKYTADKRKHPIKRLALFAAALLLSGTLLLVGLFAYVYDHIDEEADEMLFCLARSSHTTRFYYRDTNGTATIQNQAMTHLLPEGYRPVEWEEQRIHGGTNSIYCEYDDIPAAMKDAFVAIEDKRFFQHDGVDWLRTVKAAANYLLHFDDRFGGSTITQQLVKNISAEDEISPARKMREMCRALRLEKTHSKEEILELYLNIVPLSQGCVGVGAAAELYFGKPIADLSTAECATIAAITNSPVRFDPYTAGENNRARRDLILRQMLERGMLEPEEYHAAVREELCLRPLPKRREPVYDWYVETVITDVITDLMQEKGLSREAAEKLLYHGGLQIYTQMDISVQKQLTAYFENTANFPRECQNGLSYAMVVCDPYTGDLLGIISSIGEKKENRILNYGADVLRAPGSALKPLSVYAPAIEENLITWSTVFDDVPLRFTKEAGTYTAWPHNAPLVYSGLTDVQDAVALSKNTVAVRILERLGAERAYGYLEKLGVDTLVRSRATAKGQRVTDLTTAPMALGQLSDGVSVRALTNAYGALANGGEYRTSRSYSLVLDGQGKPLLQKKVTGKRVFSRQTASMMTKLLHGVCTYGTAKHLRLDDMVDTAGKTGTSSESRDKWFVGYTPYYTAGIWCGYADGSSPVPDSLSQTHLATWDAIMQQLHRPYTAHGEERTFSVASGLVRRSYCKDSGLLPCEACRKDPRGDRITEGYFKAGTEPRRTCDCHVTVLYDKDGGGIAREGCPHTSVEEIAMLRLPARQFPVEVYVTDAQFGYRDLGEASPSYESGKPFYANLLMPGDHVGLSRTGNGKQFNCMCPAHGDELQETDEALPDKKYPFDWFARYFSRFAGNTA